MKNKLITLTWNNKMNPIKGEGDIELYDKKGCSIYSGRAKFANKTVKIKLLKLPKHLKQELTYIPTINENNK